MALKFATLCSELANKLGGYTLWLGAGVAKALTKGRAPTWDELTTRLVGSTPLPPHWDTTDYAARLEWISKTLGHEAFRRELRRLVVTDAVLNPDIDEAIVRDMAVIGARAGAIVSFNIEAVSSVPVAASPGGSSVLRPYLRDQQPPISVPTDGGITSKPVFFPHGLLDIHGECVLTRSEYKAHGITMAVSTAINLCLGGDLVILGMSLGDEYLRDTIVHHRNWIRNVFWIANQHDHEEWARIASVHCVKADHHEVWKGIADAHRNADRRNELADGSPPRDLESRAVRAVRRMQTFLSEELPAELDKIAIAYAGNPSYYGADLVRFARQCRNLGLPVPGAVLNDRRYIEQMAR